MVMLSSSSSFLLPPSFLLSPNGERGKVRVYLNGGVCDKREQGKRNREE